MSTEAINRQRSNAASKEDRTERAMRAVKVFRSMQFGLTAYARAVTQNPKVRVEIGTGAPHTNGETIFYRPPIRLGDNLKHDRMLCDKRDDLGLLDCPACSIREEVLVNIYHEIAHIAFDTFASTTDEDKRNAVSLAVDEWGTKYSAAIVEAIGLAPSHITSSYIGLSRLISPFLPHLLNCLEDARVDSSMFNARKGTRKMLQADTYSLLRDGIPQPDGSVQIWEEAPLNSQAGLACYLMGAGYAGWEQYLHPEIRTDFADAELKELVLKVRDATTASETYALAFPILARARELGYFKMPEEESEDETDEEENNNESDDRHGDEEQAPEQAEHGEPSGEPSSDDEDGTSEEPGGESSEGGRGDENESQSGNADADEDSDETELRPDSLEGNDGGDGDDTDETEGSGPGDSDADEEEASSGSKEEEECDLDGSDNDGLSQESEEEGGDGSGIYGDSDQPGESDPDSPTPESDERPEPENDPRGSEDESFSSDDQESEDSPEELDGGGSEDVHCPDLGSEREGKREKNESEGDSGGSLSSIDYSSQSDGDDSVSLEDESEPDTVGPDTEQSGETGDDDEQPDREPEAIDSGADKGLGGIQVVEAPLPEYGDDKQMELAMDSVHEQTIANGDAVQESEPDRSAVEMAVIQGMYFETPSAIVSEVNEYKISDDGINCFNVGEQLDPYERIELGIECDTEVSESILGPNLLALRRIFSDNKTTKMERNRRSGKVNSKSLGRRAWSNDDRLFQKKRLPGKRDYAVMIGIDISSSNLGANLALVKRTAMAQAELCHRLGVKFAVYAHCCDVKRGSGGASHTFTMEMYHIKSFSDAWNPEAINTLEGIGAAGGNLDGHALEFFRRAMDKVQATDKVIMYLTDGKMPAANHDEELEILQREIRTCRQRDYTLVGVGIRTDSPMRHGLDTVMVEDDSDHRKVVDFLGKRLAGR